MHKNCLVGLLRETKILVSAWENAKLNDWSMSAHFIKMRVNGSFHHIFNVLELPLSWPTAPIVPRRQSSSCNTNALLVPNDLLWERQQEVVSVQPLLHQSSPSKVLYNLVICCSMVPIVQYNNTPFHSIPPPERFNTTKKELLHLCLTVAKNQCLQEHT